MTKKQPESTVAESDAGPGRQGVARRGLPLVAIAGRPNVGKSTIFNRLVGRRKAIVQDTPGVTRDRIFGEVEWGRFRFLVVDTGGLDPISPSEALTGKIRSQIDRAFSEADLVLFVVDGRSQICPQDMEIARMLRKTRKPIVCAVNKIDTAASQENAYPFYKLGLDPLFPLSAEHGIGFDDLLDHIVKMLPQVEEGAVERPEGPERIKLAVVGRPNVGKSTLVNRLLGDERQVVDEMPGTTRDSVDITFGWSGEDFLLIDTAGIRRKGKVKETVEKYAVVKALQSMDLCDVGLLLVDAVEGVTDQDAHIGGYILERGKAAVVLVNKWDLAKSTGHGPAEMIKEVRRGLPHMAFVPILPVSAVTGYNVDKAMREVCRVHGFYRMQVATGPLNRLLEEAVRDHPPPSEGTQIRKLNYITQIRTSPPLFVIFANSPRGIHFSYQRYLVGRIRGRFGFDGVPIRLIFRSKR